MANSRFAIIAYGSSGYELAAISDCLSSSREKIMTSSGSKRCGISRQHCFPNEPVPPLIKMVLPHSIGMGRVKCLEYEGFVNKVQSVR